MKDFIKKAIVLSFFLIFAASSYGIEVNLKISGALCYLNLEHINRTLSDWEEWIKKAGPFYEVWNYKEGDVKKFHLATAFECELIFSITPRLAAGIGTGYIYGEIPDEKTALTLDKFTVTHVHVKPFKINAFPLNFSAHYFHTLGKKLKLFAKGGIGLAWAKYVDREGIEISEKKYSYYWQQDATAQGQVYFAGLGLIYDADPHYRFFIEGEVKLARISGFKGKTAEGEDGSLFYFEEYEPNLDFWQARIKILTETPTGENIRSAQETVADFSGFSVKIGILIKF